MQRSLEEVRQIEQNLKGEISTVWNDEIKRRLDQIDSGSVNLISGDQVRAEIAARLSQKARARLRA